MQIADFTVKKYYIPPHCFGGAENKKRRETMFKKILSRFFGKKSDAKKTEEKKQNIIKPMMQPTVEEVKKTAPIVTVKAEQEKSEPVGIKEEETVLQSENHQADFCAAVEKEPTEDISDKLYKRRYAPKKKEEEQENVLLNSELPFLSAEENPVEEPSQNEIVNDSFYEIADETISDNTIVTDDETPFMANEIEIVEEAEEIIDGVIEVSADTPISKIDKFPARAADILLKKGINIIGQIMELSDAELMGIRSGYKIIEIRKKFKLCEYAETEGITDEISEEPFVIDETDKFEETTEFPFMTDEKEAVEEIIVKIDNSSDKDATNTEEEIKVNRKKIPADTLINDLKYLSVRAKEALIKNNVTTFGQIMDMSEDEISRLKAGYEIIAFRNDYEIISDKGNDTESDVKPFDISEIEEAEQIVDNAEDKPVFSYDYKDNTHTQNLDLSVRTRNALCRHGILTFGQLIAMTDDEIIDVRNLGKTSFDEVIEFRRKINGSEYSETEEKEIEETVVEYYEEKYSDEMPVDMLELSVRSKNCLGRAGITTLGMLMRTSNEDIRKIPSLGSKSYHEIIHFRDDTGKKILIDKIQKLPENIKNTLEEFVANLDADELTANEIKSECISYINEEQSEEEMTESWWQLDTVKKVVFDKISDVLLKHKIFGVKLSEIYDTVPAPKNIALEILGNLSVKDHGKRYIQKSISVIELLEKDEKTNETHIDMLKCRMNGATLEEIALEYDLTRERVRQIVADAVNKARELSEKNRINITEERFRPLFEKYNFDEELFCTLTEQNRETYMYLKTTAKSGNLPFEELFSDMKVPKWFRNNWEEYCRKSTNSKYLFVTEDNNRRIEKSRYSIRKYVISIYCRNDTYFDNFVSLYHNFLEKFGLADNERLRITESEIRSQENQIRDSEYVLWKFGRKFRYYNINAGDYTELFDELNLQQYENTEISTLKIFRDNSKLMKQYDIHDEYELHNLLRKIDCEKINSQIKFGKTPNISFGEFDRENMIKEYMLKLAPISKENLAKVISEDYGYREETILGQLGYIDDYYHDGIYTIDFEKMPDEMMSEFSEKLTEDFYYLKDAENIFVNTFPDADLSLLNPFNLKSMGFIVNTTYIIKNHSSASAYFEMLLTENDIADIKPLSEKFAKIMQYNAILIDLKDDYTIIEFEPYQYINFRKLEKMGINKSDFRKYCDDVNEYTWDKVYFTIEGIRKSGFESDVDSLGFEAWFYSSLLREDERFVYKKIGGTVLFAKSGTEVSTQELIVYTVNENESVEIDKLIELIEENYSITLDKDNLKWCIKNTELYYNEDMDKVYVDYDTFLDEFNSIDDEEDEYEFI